MPSFLFRWRLKQTLNSFSKIDLEAVNSRVSYYNKQEADFGVSDKSKRIGDLKIPKKLKVYFLDALQYLRYFPSHFKFDFLFGDVKTVPKSPSIVKSRPISAQNNHSVLLNLNKVRHFIFVKNDIPLSDKIDQLVWRGGVWKYQPHRVQFLEQFGKHSLCNVKMVNGNYTAQPNLKGEKMSIREQLAYKFVLTIEGNDVATNLKWVMSSNSVAVMPEPRYETWFMEGALLPDVHYICIKDDFSNFEERIRYFIGHPEKLAEIAENANIHVQQFQNPEQEDLISLKVLEKYFKKSGQY
jgi:hypothetical protein